MNTDAPEPPNRSAADLMMESDPELARRYNREELEQKLRVFAHRLKLCADVGRLMNTE